MTATCSVFAAALVTPLSVDSVLAAQDEHLESALWAALKTLEESASLSRRMARSASERDQEWLARSFAEKSHEAEQHALTIRQVLREDTPGASSGNGLKPPVPAQ